MKLLVGIDGHGDDARAVEWALDRTGPEDDLAVAVVEGRGDPETVRSLLAAADREATVRQIGADNPGGDLVEIAMVEGVDEIALAGGERSPMGKIRLGTLREFVVLNADVTVTLVR